MAPVVESVGTYQSSGASSSHDLNLPSGVTSGDLLLAFVSSDGRRSFTMTGWTTLFSDTDNVGGSGTGGNSLHIAYRVATGSDPVTVGVSSNEDLNGIIYRVSGHEDPGTQAPEVATNVQSGNTPGTNSDPPVLNPAGGALDYLWVTGVSVDNEDITVVPDNGYVDNATIINTAGAGEAPLAVAWRTRGVASSENPTAWGTWASETHIGFTLAVTPTASEPTDHTKTPTDSLGLTDARARTVGKPRTDTLGLTDARARVFGKLRSDALGASDTSARVWGAIRTPSDGLGLTDAQERAIQRVLGENVGLTDQVTPVLFMLITKVVTDALGLTDSRARTLGRSIADPLGLTDNRLRRLDRALTDALGLDDSVGRVFARVLAAEALGLLDDATTDLQGGGQFTRTVTETLGLLDSSPRTADFMRSTLEALGLTDTPLRAAGFARAVTDSEGLTDAAAALLVQLISRVVTDNLGGLDSAATAQGFARAVNDAAGLTDSLLRDFTREVTDTEGLVDALTRGIERVLTEALGLTDTADASVESTLITYITAVVVAEVLSQEYDVKVNRKVVAEAVQQFTSLSPFSNAWSQAYGDGAWTAPYGDGFDEGFGD